jgi:hypothetical protein
MSGAWLLVYQSASVTLADKERVTLQLIEARYEARRATESKQLDDRLLERALALAGRVQVETDWTSLQYRTLHCFGAITTPTGPMAHLVAAPWLLQTQPRGNGREGFGLHSTCPVRLGDMAIRIELSQTE